MSNCLFFYGHRRGTKAVFSNFYPCQFQEKIGSNEGSVLTFQHSEQYLMWRKAKLFGDEQIAGEILASSNPMACKKLGRQVTRFNQQTWNEQAQSIMVVGLLLKFSQNPELGQILLDTGDQVLVEASPQDRIWGIGLGPRNPDRLDPKKWRGSNWLGECLMIVRDKLKTNAS